jgi:anaerobic ribonucleoside-triphosphate reductase activating protein
MSSPINITGRVANIVTSFLEIPAKICSSVYFTGCIFNCPQCQNPELQNFSYGTKKCVNDVLNDINKNSLAEWVCFLGGEPFYQHEFLFELCLGISKPIGIYTGYELDELKLKFPNILNIDNVKFLKTGKYVYQLTQIDEFPITSNQKIFTKQNNDWILCEHRNVDDIGKLMTKLF